MKMIKPEIVDSIEFEQLTSAYGNADDSESLEFVLTCKYFKTRSEAEAAIQDKAFQEMFWKSAMISVQFSLERNGAEGADILEHLQCIKENNPSEVPESPFHIRSFLCLRLKYADVPMAAF